MDFLVIFAVLACVVEGSRMAVKKYCAKRSNKLAVTGGLKEGLLKEADCINDKTFGIPELEACTCPCCEHKWSTKPVERVDTDSQEETDSEASTEKEISVIGDYVPPAPPTVAEGKGKGVVDEEQGTPSGYDDFHGSEEVESLRESKDRKTSAKIFPLPPESEVQAEAAVQKPRPDYNFMRSGSGLGSQHYGLNHSPLSSGEISDIPAYVGREDGREVVQDGQGGQGQGGQGQGGHQEDQKEEETIQEEEAEEKEIEDNDLLTFEGGEDRRTDGQGCEEGHEKELEKEEEKDTMDNGGEEKQLNLSSWPDGQGNQEGPEEGYGRKEERGKMDIDVEANHLSISNSPGPSMTDGSSAIQTPPRAMPAMRAVVDMSSIVRSLAKTKRRKDEEKGKKDKDKDKRKGKDDEKKDKDKKDRKDKDKDDKKEKKKDKDDEEKKGKKDKVKKDKKG